MLGNQDTLYVKTVNTGTIARAYFRDSYIEGDTDFIFGRGTTVFDHSEIHTMGNNKTSSGTNKVTGTATGAPSTEVTNLYGFLYISSKFTADANVTVGGTYLARQWYEGNRPQAAGKMIVRNSTIGAHINATTPWQPWVGRTILAPYPDGGAPGDGGADAGAQPTAPGGVLYTSADYYALIGGGPSPAEPYIGEYGNIGPSAGGGDGGTTPTDAGARRTERELGSATGRRGSRGRTSSPAPSPPRGRGGEGFSPRPLAPRAIDVTITWMAKREPLGIRKIEALHYYVHDLERTRRFFVDKLDFAELGRQQPGARARRAAARRPRSRPATRSS